MSKISRRDFLKLMCLSGIGLLLGPFRFLTSYGRSGPISPPSSVPPAMDPIPPVDPTPSSGKTLSEALSYNNITQRPIGIVDVASYFNLKKPFTLSALMKILLKKVVHSARSTTKLYQLTGESSTSRTYTQCQLIGTDLGSSFEHNGHICFLFGDTVGYSWNNQSWGRAISSIEDKDPELGPSLKFAAYTSRFSRSRSAVFYWSI